MADVHLHFNWDQEELVSADEAINSLRENNVTLAVVTATPSSNAEKLRKAGGDWVLPIFGPYIDLNARYGWFNRPDVLTRAREALQSGNYFGIGELHLMIGLGPKRDNKIFVGLIKLAQEFDVPMMVHTEAASYKYFVPVCKKYPKVRFLWAHAGGILGPDHSDAMIKACPNVWIELSARDPDHYGSFLNKDGSIPDGWLKVFKKHPQRFMVGTDPVWAAQEVHRWDRADEGWKHYKKFSDFHRGWMAKLPAELEENIRLRNALKFWRVK